MSNSTLINLQGLLADNVNGDITTMDMQSVVTTLWGNSVLTGAPDGNIPVFATDGFANTGTLSDSGYSIATLPVNAATVTALTSKLTKPAVTGNNNDVLTYNGGLTAWVSPGDLVGLENVDNTSDANKPISTLTQTALDGKQADLIIALADLVTDKTYIFGEIDDTRVSFETTSAVGFTFSHDIRFDNLAELELPIFSDEVAIGSAATREGEIYYDNTDNTVKFSNGSAWIDITDSATMTYDPLDSGLSSTTTKGAIDELAAWALNTDPVLQTGGAAVTDASRMVRLTETTYASIVPGTGDSTLTLYTVANNTWTASAPLSIASYEHEYIARLADTVVVVWSVAGGDLSFREYTHTAGVWATSSNLGTIVDATPAQIAPLTATSIAVAYTNATTNSIIETYVRSGLDWIVEGTAYNFESISATMAGNLIPLNSTTVAYIDTGALQTFQYAATTWGPLGATLAAPTATVPAIPTMVPLSATSFLYGEHAPYMYTYAGLTWTKSASPHITIAANQRYLGVGVGGNNERDFHVHSLSADTIATYRYGWYFTSWPFPVYFYD